MSSADITLTVLLTCEENYPPQACLDALAIAGVACKTVVCLNGQGKDALIARNRAAAEASSPFLLLLSSNVLPAQNSLPPLLERLAAATDLAGINPLLISKHNVKETAPCVLHLGYVADSRGQLHSLYEGIAVDHPLAAKKRIFQAAHEAALLLRREDFLAVDGFQPQLEELSFVDFCLRLTAARGGAFSSEPAARAVLCDRFDSWKRCGLWNSLLQRGKIDPAALQPDYHKQAQHDGLPLTLSPWLHPCPLPPEDGIDKTGDSAWLRWRRTADPSALLALLYALPPQKQADAVALCRELPSTLPRAAAWYKAQAKTILAFAERENLPTLTAQLRSWNAKTNMFRERLLKPAISAFAKAGIYNCALDNSPAVYDAWLELKECRKTSVEVGREWPKIAVLMPVYNGNPVFLRAALDSVLGQIYSNWQLCIADDASTLSEIPALLREYAAREPRVRVTFREKNGHISQASNSALELVDAPWTALMDHDDMLAPNALLEVARAAADRPALRCLYSDDDKIDAQGVRRNPSFKACFDRYLNFYGHLSSYFTQTLRAVKGLRTGYEGSQDFDLSLRVTEILKPSEIAHIPHILYHWRVHEQSAAGSMGAKSYALEATRKAFDAYIQRKGISAAVAPAGRNNFFTLFMQTPQNLSISVVLLTRSQQAEMPDCLHTLGQQACLQIIRQKLEANGESGDWADACNEAALKATGEVILFLDAELVPSAGCRPEQLAALALRPDVSMVGGCICKNGLIWHAGLYPDITGLPFPLLRNFSPRLKPSLCWGQLLLTRRALAASWRCMAVRRENFLHSGGFDVMMGALGVADYCLRQEKQALSCLISPWAWWDLPAHDIERPLAPDIQKNFIRRWGETVKGHGLRNPNMHAAADYGWTLNLEK